MDQVVAVESMTSSEQRNGQALMTQRGSGRALTDYDDDALLVRAQDGDKESYEVLVNRYMDFVVSVSTRFLGDVETGRDVAQDVFLELWLSRHRYVPESRFKGYLTTLVLNRCRDATRRRGSEQRRRDGLAAQGKLAPPDAADKVIQDQTANRLHQALSQLDAADREILVMRYGMDLAYDVIAQETGRPAGTLRSRVFHALRKLRGVLEGES